MKFQAGVSGNPGGRPKGRIGLGAKIREKYGDDGDKLINELHRYAFGKVKKCPAHVRMQAIGILLERGWGKAPQELIGDPTRPVHHQIMFGGRYRPSDAA